MGVQYSVIFAYIIGILFLFVLGRLLLVPMKYVLRFVFNGLLGGAVILLVNFIGGFFEFQIALNIVSALVVGFLGIPGALLLVILKNLL